MICLSQKLRTLYLELCGLLDLESGLWKDGWMCCYRSASEGVLANLAWLDLGYAKGGA